MEIQFPDRCSHNETVCDKEDFKKRESDFDLCGIHYCSALYPSLGMREEISHIKKKQ